MRSVVQSHNGSVPLASIVACYEADFDPLVIDPEEGVPLEHLISCVKHVIIQQGVTGIKSIISVGGDEDVSAA
jgi:meiosis arrest female protein 1